MNGSHKDQDPGIDSVLAKLMSDELSPEIDGREFAERVLPVLVKLEDMRVVALEKTADLIAKYGDFVGRRPSELRNLYHTLLWSVRGDDSCLSALFVLAHNYISGALTLNTLVGLAAIISEDLTDGFMRLYLMGRENTPRCWFFCENAFNVLQFITRPIILDNFKAYFKDIKGIESRTTKDALQKMHENIYRFFNSYNTFLKAIDLQKSELGLDDVLGRLRTANYGPFLPLDAMFYNPYAVIGSLFLKFLNTLFHMVGWSEWTFEPTGKFEEDFTKLWERSSQNVKIELEYEHGIKGVDELLDPTGREFYEISVKAYRAPLSWGYVCLKKLSGGVI
jgi:hypothetical protein